jgi:hypothetical protein
VTDVEGRKLSLRRKMFTLISSLTKSFSYCRENALSKSMQINLDHKILKKLKRYFIKLSFPFPLHKHNPKRVNHMNAWLVKVTYVVNSFQYVICDWRFRREWQYTLI